MIVKFVTECEITICEDTEDEEGLTEVFHVGQNANFDIFGYPKRLVNGEWVEDKDYVNVQFADGSVAFGIDTDWYEVIDTGWIDPQPKPQPKPKEQQATKKVAKTFTLSMYDRGQQWTKGRIPPGSSALASFSESMSPLKEMIATFANLPLGTKIKVTMEQVGG